jgi:uncharacterized protein (TIGR03435 family)
LAKKAALALVGTAAVGAPVVIGMLNTTITRAQTAPGVRPRFEVASIKPCKPGDLPSGGRSGGLKTNGTDPGRLHLTCQTLDGLIRQAYILFARVGASGRSMVSSRVMNQPFTDEPEWAHSQRYTIDAKPESAQTLETMNGPMLQTLLEDRFQLKIHHEPKDVPVYALLVGKGGSKLNPTVKGSCIALDFSQGPPPVPQERPRQPKVCGPFRPDKNGGMETLGQTLAGLSMQFSEALDRDVVDRTGLTGEFDMHLDLSNEELFPWERPADPTAPQPDALSAITRAVQKLGLRLEPSKASADFLAIDRVERPSEN